MYLYSVASVTNGKLKRQQRSGKNERRTPVTSQIFQDGTENIKSSTDRALVPHLFIKLHQL